MGKAFLTLTGLTMNETLSLSNGTTVELQAWTSGSEMMASSHCGNSDAVNSQQHALPLYEVKLATKEVKVQLGDESPSLQSDVS